VDDCGCKIESIDKFNNYKIHPLISILVQKDYFRFIKVNLKKICQFWHDDAKCGLKDCQLKVCNEVSTTNLDVIVMALINCLAFSKKRKICPTVSRHIFRKTIRL
jgi:hypothetical protein